MLEQPTPQQAQEDASTRQAMEEGKRQYEQQLRATFDAIIAGRVTEASEKLVVVTEWLLGSVRALGTCREIFDHCDANFARFASR